MGSEWYMIANNFLSKGFYFGLVAIFVVAISGITTDKVQAYPRDNCAVPLEYVSPREIDGKLKIVNDTDFDMYAICDGINLGRVLSNSSEEFWVKCGEQYVEVEVQGLLERTGKDINISPHERWGEVTFSPSDFMRLPKRKR